MKFTIKGCIVLFFQNIMISLRVNLDSFSFSENMQCQDMSDLGQVITSLLRRAAMKDY